MLIVLQRSLASKQLMGQLPTIHQHEYNRQGRLELWCGLCRTILCQTGIPWTNVQVKCDISIFICLAVKAVHLQLVSNLKSDPFIAALPRFIARRGKCWNSCSDYGTTFVRAHPELRERRKHFPSEAHQWNLPEFAYSETFTWAFIPPHSPHFERLCVAGVRSMKYRLD